MGVIPFLHFNLLVQNNLNDAKVIFQMNFNVIMSIMTLIFYSSICHILMIMLVKYFLIGNFFLIVSVQTYDMIICFFLSQFVNEISDADRVLFEIIPV